MVHAQKDVDNTRRKTPFKPVIADGILDFPEISERYLMTFFTGSYQLSLAVSYLAEMLDRDGKLTLEYVKEELNVDKCLIRYKPNSFGVSGVTHFACECANGRRTDGCCLHIDAIVYYLSHTRYICRKFFNQHKYSAKCLR